MERVVVVGGGIAGLTAAHALRDEGFAGELTLIGEEPTPTYSRPVLSKAALVAAEVGGHELSEPTHGGSELRGRRATGVRVDDKAVQLDDGTELPFDGLVIATGAGVRKLTDSPYELALRTVADAEAVHARLAAKPSVVVVGSGPLAMELASGAVERGCVVTVVCDGVPMERHLGNHLAALLAEAAVAHGVRLVGSRAVKAEAGPDAARVETSSGEVVTADVLVTAVGDHTHDDWLESSGLLTDGRLLVDTRGRVLDAEGTPHPDIVAAGDVSWWPSPAGPRRSPLWTSAIDQAGVAARGLVHGDAAHPFEALPYFWTEQFGLHVRVVGPLPVAGAPVVVESDEDSPRALLHWPSNVAVGTAVAVNYRMPIPRLRKLALLTREP